MDNVRGDKVVWIIVLLLMLFSIVLIFSSSSRLTNETTDRLDIVKDQHWVIPMSVLCLITYSVLKKLSKNRIFTIVFSLIKPAVN